MERNINGLMELPIPIRAQTMMFLIKMSEPCSGMLEGGRVVFKDHGEFTIKEVINDENFTIHLDKQTLPTEVQLTHVEVKIKNKKPKHDDHKITQEIQNLKDSIHLISKEVQNLKDSILDDSRLKTLNVRMSLLENVVAESLEKL